MKKKHFIKSAFAFFFIQLKINYYIKFHFVLMKSVLSLMVRRELSVSATSP